jgi:hypothetical protein
MVLRGIQTHRRDQTKCRLVPPRFLPRDLARLYGRVRPFTSVDLGGVVGPCLDEGQIWTDSLVWNSFATTQSRRCETRQPHNQLPDAEETVSVPGHCRDRPDAVYPDRRDVGLMRRE